MIAQATILQVAHRTQSPVPVDHSPSASITTQLPSIHRILHPQTRPDVLQRPRGLTLPSYAPSGSGHNPQQKADFVETGNRIHRKERSSTISGRPPEAYRQANNTHVPPSPPAVGMSLPPIRVGNDSPLSPSFSGLPPLQSMLPSPSHMLSLDSRSPVSPRSPHSVIHSSSSWSSHVNTSASSGDISGRFHHRPLPPFDVHHRRKASPNSSHSPPPSQYDDEPANVRSRETLDEPDAANSFEYMMQHHMMSRSWTGSSSSLLTLTAPRRSSASRLGPEKEYASDNFLRMSRSREAIPEDVAITSASSSINFPSSAPSAGRRIGSLGMSERGANFDGSSQQGRYLGGDSMIGGTFDMSEGEGRFKPGETSGGKKRRSRATQEQLDILNGVYQRTPFPTTVERTELAQQLGMTPRSVQIWFQNKRQGAKNNETRRRELPPLISTLSNSPQMPSLVPLSLAPPASASAPSLSPPSPIGGDARSISHGPEGRRESIENLRGRARRRRMSVNDMLSHDGRDEIRSATAASRHITRQRVEDKGM